MQSLLMTTICVDVIMTESTWTQQRSTTDLLTSTTTDVMTEEFTRDSRQTEDQGPRLLTTGQTTAGGAGQLMTTHQADDQQQDQMTPKTFGDGGELDKTSTKTSVTAASRPTSDLSYTVRSTHHPADNIHSRLCC